MKTFLNIQKRWKLYSVGQYARTSALQAKLSPLILLTIVQVKSFDAL